MSAGFLCFFWVSVMLSRSGGLGSHITAFWPAVPNLTAVADRINALIGVFLTDRMHLPVPKPAVTELPSTLAIQVLTMAGSLILSLQAEPNMTVCEVRQKAEHASRPKTKGPPKGSTRAKLLYEGCMLEDDATLQETGMSSGATLVCLLGDLNPGTFFGMAWRYYGRIQVELRPDHTLLLSMTRGRHGQTQITNYEGTWQRAGQSSVARFLFHSITETSRATGRQPTTTNTPLDADITLTAYIIGMHGSRHLEVLDMRPLLGEGDDYEQSMYYHRTRLAHAKGMYGAKGKPGKGKCADLSCHEVPPVGGKVW